MKIINMNSVEPVERQHPLFTGTVTRQQIVSPEESENYNMAIVNFPKTVHCKFHTHDCDQILIVTAGTGIVATEDEETVVTVGDVIFIPADENHWHGAGPDSDFSHITITIAGSVMTQLED